MNFYWEKHSNFGDLLNYHLIKHIIKQEPTWIPKDTGVDKFFVVGSILVYADEFTHVWGSGLISDYERSLPKNKPKRIYSVRGPMTRARLIDKINVNVPEIYGDPSMLMPYFYKPKSIKKYKYGIIPHYIDMNNQWIQKHRDAGCRIIDMRCTVNDIYRIIDEINECEFIISSSLHGMIIPDAYGIKSMWIDFTNDKGTSEVFGAGFKFKDYFMSVNRPVTDPYVITNDSNVKIDDIISTFKDYEIKIDLDKLYESCPFKK